MMRRFYVGVSVGLALLFLLIPATVLAQWSVADSGLEFKGVVEDMPANGLVGEWQIGGLTFQATTSTKFEVEHGPLAVGACVEVKYFVDNGVNVATKISTESADDCGDASSFEFKGILEEMPVGGGSGTWTVSGVDFQATSTTQFRTEHGPLVVGACVEVKYIVQGGQNVALKIASEEPKECQQAGVSKQEVHGTVDAMPSDGLVGTWVIDGVEYEATNATVFEQRDGPFGVGACVEVEFVVQGSTRVALKIKTDDDCGASGNAHKVYGVVEVLPAGLIGTWTISGTQYEVTSTTELKTPHGPFAVGVCVEVKYTLSGTTRLALEIETESPDECGLRVEGEFEVKGIIEQMPSDGLVGQWVISGQTYTTTAQTRFEQEHGAFEVGRCVEVKYTVSGSDRIATKIETKRQQACSSQEEHEVYGEIEALPAGGLIGTWTIGGQEYVVTTTTKLEDGPFFVGLLVEVHFVVSDDGTLIATKIEGKHAVDDDDRLLGQAYGRIDAFPADLVGTWTIGGLKYEARTTTKFEQDEGPFAVGACAKVRYFLENGTRVAAKIETESPGDCSEVNGMPVSRLVGFVEDMPPQGFVGTWTIGGTLVEVTATTKIEEEHGALVVGAFVKVKYVQQGGVNLALEIETHVPPEAGDFTRIGYLRKNGTTWSVDGQDFIVTDVTILDDSRAPLTDGQPVVVNAYAAPGAPRLSSTLSQATATAGTLTATRVTAIEAIYNLYLPVLVK